MKKLVVVGLILVLAGMLAGCQLSFLPTPPAAPTTAINALPTGAPARPTNTALPALNSPNGPPLRMLEMVTLKDGWGLISNALLLTHDGGFNWLSVPLPEGQVDEASTGFFVNENVLYLVVPAPDGRSGQLYYSKNGGGTWKITNVPFIRGQLVFMDKTGYFLVRTRTGSEAMKITIFASEDNGATWKAIFPGANQDPGNDLPEAGNKTGFAFINSQRGWMGLASQPKSLGLYRTDNGGRNWNPQTIPAPQNIDSLTTTINPPVFFPGNSTDGMLPVVFSGQGGGETNLVFYATTDGGAGWFPGAPVPGGQAYSFIDPKTGWVWGKRGLYFTNDGAQTWQVLPVAFGRTEQANSIKFIDKENGWLLTTDSKNRVRVYSSSDGGNTWVAINP